MKTKESIERAHFEAFFQQKSLILHVRCAFCCLKPLSGQHFLIQICGSLLFMFKVVSFVIFMRIVIERTFDFKN